MRFRFAVLAAVCMVNETNAIKIEDMAKVENHTAFTQVENENDTEAKEKTSEPLVSLLARATSDQFQETGFTGSTMSALLSGYDPLMTVPGAMTGFAKARACDQDGKKVTLALPIDERCPELTHPVTVRLGASPNPAVKALRANPISPILASALSKPACLNIDAHLKK